MLTPGEWRFVLAHEMLHAALRHGDRVGPRDPYLWNVATDYVVNGWLVEMGVGEMPDGLLYDPALQGRGAEDVYDGITEEPAPLPQAGHAARAGSGRHARQAHARGG